MKKQNYIVIVGILLVVVAISSYFIGYMRACNKNTTLEMEPNTFYAEITDIRDNCFSIEGLSINDINYRGNFDFSIIDGQTALVWRGTPMALNEFNVGDLVAITFSGSIQETDPASISNVEKVQLLDDEK